MADYEFIRIVDEGTTASGKTHIYRVTSHRGDLLGNIRWYSRWRQYVFAPSDRTLYSAGCMADIEGFIRSLR